MYLKACKRRKNGKEHRYFSVVESRRMAGGKVFQRQVLYLGEINDSQEAAWRDRLEPARTMFTHAPAAFYYDTLQPLASRIDLWETTYYHVVAGPEALLDWYRGTGLRPFLEALAGDEERRDFERKLLHRYAAAYPRQPDGRVLFPFQRLFFVAYR